MKSFKIQKRKTMMAPKKMALCERNKSAEARMILMVEITNAVIVKRLTSHIPHFTRI
jgi:hypothetical protein